VEQKPPVDDHLIEFQFPQVKERKLDNGLTLMVIEHFKIPKVYFRVGLDFGEKHDPAGQEGAVELLSLLLKKGTRNYSYRKLVEKIDSVGGHLDIQASEDFFYLNGEFLKEYQEVGMELLCDVLMHPLLPADEMQKERAKMIADLENEKSSPQFLASRQMDRVLFSSHPYGKHKTVNSLKQISRELLVQLHRENVNPANTYMVIAGDISFNEALELTGKYFDTWQAGSERVVEFPPPEPRKNQEVYLVNRPGSEQSNLLLGDLLFGRKHSEYEKVLVMNKILGGSASGRLFMKLREEKGYTYGAYSTLHTFKDTGSWVANAEVRTEVTDSALSVFFEEFERMKSEPPGAEELKNAKRYLMGIFPLQNETPASMAALALHRKLFDLPDDYWSTYLKKIDRVSETDVQQMAQKYITDRMAIVVVGDGDKVAPKLSPFGTVQVLDLEGNEVK